MMAGRRASVKLTYPLDKPSKNMERGIYMTTQPTNEEMLETILMAINDFASSTEERFQGMDQKFDRIDRRFDHLETRTARIESTMATKEYVAQEMNKVKAEMVTKDYLDNKLADLKGDLILLARKSNRKFETLVEDLFSEGRLTRQTADKILSLEPFAKA
jgi:hypothetical protein